MELKKYVSLNVLAFCGYLNVFFAISTLIFYEVLYEILGDIFSRKIPMMSIYDISYIFQIFLYIGYILIGAVIVEFFIKRKHIKESQNSAVASKSVQKIILSIIYSLIIYIGLLLEILFVIAYTFLNLTV